MENESERLKNNLITRQSYSSEDVLRTEDKTEEVNKLLSEGDYPLLQDIHKVEGSSTSVEYEQRNRVKAMVNESSNTLPWTNTVYETEIGRINDPRITRVRVEDTGEVQSFMSFISDTKQVSLAAQMFGNTSPKEIIEEDAFHTMLSSMEWQMFYGKQKEGHSKEYYSIDSMIPENNIIDASIGVTYKSIKDQVDYVRSLGADKVNVYMSGYFVERIFETGNTNQIMTYLSLKERLNLKLTKALDPIFVNTNDIVPNANSMIFDVEEMDESTEATDEYLIALTDSDNNVSYANGIKPVKLKVSEQSKVRINLYRLGRSYGKVETVELYRKVRGEETFQLTDRRFLVDGRLTVTLNTAKPTGTVDMFVGALDSSVIELEHLLPVIQLPMARVNATTTMSYLHYGALKLYVPNAWVKFENLGLS